MRACGYGDADLRRGVAGAYVEGHAQIAWTLRKERAALAAPQPSDNLQQASTAQVEPVPVGCPDLGDAEEFAEMLAGHGGMLAQAIEQVDGCMDETLVEPEDAAAWQIVKKHILPAQATPEGADLPPLDEHAAFEAWARDPVRSEKLPLERWVGNGAYVDSRTYIAFYGWKSGRAALAATTAAEPVAWAYPASLENLATLLSLDRDYQYEMPMYAKKSNGLIPLYRAAPPQQQVDTATKKG
jgi:hypothetical protein